MLAYLTLSATAQHPELRQALQFAIANQGREVPGPETMTAEFDYLQASASPSEAAEVLPLARTCVASHNDVARRLGLGTFLVVALRPKDGAALLSGYVDFLGRLLGDSDVGVRGPITAILSDMQPAPPPSVVPYALAHLDDKGISERDILGLAQLLLRAAPHDFSVHRAILSRVKESPSVQPALWSGLIIQFGMTLGGSPSEDEQVNEFIGRALSSSQAEVQRAAIGVISGRRGLVARFAANLAQIAADQNADAPTREAAGQALASK